MPASTERNITIARDASNFQKRKVIATGIAFCTENIATTATIINNRIIVAILCLKKYYLLFDFKVRFEAIFLDATFIFPSSFAICASSFLIRDTTALTLLSSMGFLTFELRS